MIQEPTDVIIKITSTAIFGSDLHFFDGYQPGTFRDKDDDCIKVVLKR